MGSYALLYPGGVVYINEQEAHVLQLCDGAHQVQDILRAEISGDWAESAAEILRSGFEKGWLEQSI